MQNLSYPIISQKMPILESLTQTQAKVSGDKPSHRNIKSITISHVGPPHGCVGVDWGGSDLTNTSRF